MVVVIMFFGSLVLWVGVPFFWLWVGGQVQGATNSVGMALGAAAVGAFATIALLVAILGRLNRKAVEMREARGIKMKPGSTPLEIVMAVSATIAVAGFCAWFFLLGGSSPIPLMGQGG
jgi:hypothetical protein